MRCKTVLVDDHQIVLDGLIHILKSHGDLKLVGTARDGLEGLRLIENTQPELAIVDAALPGMNGFELIREVRRRKVAVPCFIMLSMHVEPHLVEQALEAGAMGYVSKSSAGTDLLTAIEQVCSGQSYVSPEVDTELQARRRTGKLSGLDPISSLTSRQRQVLQLLAEGLSPKEIGHSLGISNKTVHVFQRQIRERLNVESVADMTRLAVRHGLVKP